MALDSFRWEPHEAAAWAWPKAEPMDVWAERCIRLPAAESPTRPGKLALDPYHREPLRLLQAYGVEEVTLCWGTQIGKTLMAILGGLWRMKEDPQPGMHVMAREPDALDMCTDRYIPIIQESPELSRLVTDPKRQLRRGAIRLNGMRYAFAGAYSPAGLATWPRQWVVLDETDKYPMFAGREANPISLARERTKNFQRIKKILKTSSPTTERGYIWRELISADWRRFFLPCPHCSTYQPLIFGGPTRDGPGIKWPEDLREEKSATKVQSERLAWYQCERCAGRIEDKQKQWMLRRGAWVPKDRQLHVTGYHEVNGERLPLLHVDGKSPDPIHVSLQLSSLYSPVLRFSDVAAEFMRSYKYPDKLMNFRNGWLAEIWQEVIDEVTEDQLKAKAREEDYLMGQVPHGARVLTAGIDVQGDHFWFTIRAWGDFAESWLIKCGRILTWDALDMVLFKSRYLFRGTNNYLPLHAAFIDCAYRERAEEVYRYCVARSIQAIRGHTGMREFIKPGAKPKIAGGEQIREQMIDVDFYKARLHRLIHTKRGEPGAWHLPADAPGEYFAHMTAEQRVLVTDKRTGETGFRWQNPRRSPNHMWDCEVYALAAAHAYGVEHFFSGAVQGETPSVTTSQGKEEPPAEGAGPGPPRPPPKKPKRPPRFSRYTVRHFRR